MKAPRKTLTLKDLSTAASALVLEANAAEGKPVPPPDAFDERALPYGVAAGGNKYQHLRCPTCGKGPTTLPLWQQPQPSYGVERSFLFRDELSAKEYTISGLCQACQDDFFKEEESK